MNDKYQIYSPSGKFAERAKQVLRFLYLTHVCIPCCLHCVIKILHPDFELLKNSQPWPLEQNVTSPS